MLKYEIKSRTTLIKSAFALLSPDHLNKKVVRYKWHYTDPDPAAPINQKICSEPTDQTAQKYLYVIQLLGPSSTVCHILKLIACLPMASSEMIITSQGWAPRPTPPREKRAAPPRPAKKQVLPRPAKIGKTCGAGRGKVYLNPLKIRPLSVPIRFVRQ